MFQGENLMHFDKLQHSLILYTIWEGEVEIDVFRVF